MTISMSSVSSLSCIVLLLILCNGAKYGRSQSNPQQGQVTGPEVDLFQFALNLEFLEAEFFLYGAFGQGLDGFAPKLVMGGPPPIGARKADLNNHLRDIIAQFGYQEIGHLR